MTLRSLILTTLAAAALLAARPAAAAAAVGLGADYLTDPSAGAFQLTLAVDRPLAGGGLTLGGRVGAMLLTRSDRVGIPLDARLRAHLGRVYLEGLVGPWFVLDDRDSVRFHAGFGFGVATRNLQVGFELGVLDSDTMLGLRLAFPL